MPTPVQEPPSSDGVVHTIHEDGSQTWTKNGLKHRNNGPAFIAQPMSGGYHHEEWYQNGKLHRDDGPAYVHVGGSDRFTGKQESHTGWYQNGSLHRDNGPSEIIVNNHGIEDRGWHQNGQLHRDNGPAVESTNPNKPPQWYHRGKSVSPPAPASTPLEVKLGTNKLRQLRDHIESRGGLVGRKDLPAQLPDEIKPLLTPKGELSSKKIQDFLDSKPGLKFGTTETEWNGAQRHNDQPSRVMQLNVTPEQRQQLKDAGVHDTFESMMDTSRQSHHPVGRNTVGWVRYTKPETEEDTRAHIAKRMDQNGGADWSDEDRQAYVDRHLETARREGQFSKKPSIFMDEVQSDFGQSFGKQVAAQAHQEAVNNIEGGTYGYGPDEGAHITPDSPQEYKDRYVVEHVARARAEAEKKWPEAHQQKINEILFGGRHPNEVLHEAFHEHMRQRGHVGTPISTWTPESKAPQSGMDPDKPLPGHMKMTYGQLPQKMGMQPSFYGRGATDSIAGENPARPAESNADHYGQPLWADVIRKKEELEKVSLTSEDTARRMTPHLPYNTDYDRVETYDAGNGLFQHVFYENKIGPNYRPVMHVLTDSPQPFRGNTLASSASGLQSRNEVKGTNLPWGEGDIIQHGETASQAPRHGYGTQLYTNMAKIHGRMVSDTSTSAGANGVWEKLARNPDFKTGLGYGPGELHWTEHHGPKPDPIHVYEGDGRPIEDIIREPKSPYHTKLNWFSLKSPNDYVEAEVSHGGNKVGTRAMHVDHAAKRVYQQSRHTGGINHFDYGHPGASGIASHAIQQATGYTFGGDTPQELIKSDSSRLKHISALAVVNPDGHLLFQRRRDNQKYTTPSGHLNSHESPEQGARRELLEETNLVPHRLEYLGSGALQNKGLVIHCYRAYVDGTPSARNDPDDEAQEFRWVDTKYGLPPEIAQNLHSPDNVLLKLLGVIGGIKKSLGEGITQPLNEDIDDAVNFLNETHEEDGRQYIDPARLKFHGVKYVPPASFVDDPTHLGNQPKGWLNSIPRQQWEGELRSEYSRDFAHTLKQHDIRGMRPGISIDGHMGDGRGRAMFHHAVGQDMPVAFYSTEGLHKRVSSEELKKGAMQRLQPFKPVTKISSGYRPDYQHTSDVKDIRDWQDDVSKSLTDEQQSLADSWKETGGAGYRESLHDSLQGPEHDHDRSLIHASLKNEGVPVRTIMGQPHFLLHRGVSPSENVGDEVISFTTKHRIAQGFANRYGGQVHSSWIPADAISYAFHHSRAIGGEPHGMSAEREVLVGPHEGVPATNQELLGHINSSLNDFGSKEHTAIYNLPQRTGDDLKNAIKSESLQKAPAAWDAHPSEHEEFAAHNLGPQSPNLVHAGTHQLGPTAWVHKYVEPEAMKLVPGSTRRLTEYRITGSREPSLERAMATLTGTAHEDKGVKKFRVASFAVHPRARRHGIGRVLYEHVLRDNGGRTESDTMVSPSAQGFYEGLARDKRFRVKFGDKTRETRHGVELSKSLKNSFMALATVAGMTPGVVNAHEPMAGRQAYHHEENQSSAPPKQAWGPEGLHSELFPIAHLESNMGRNMDHAKHSKGEFHTAFGALGMKPVTAFERYHHEPHLQTLFPGVGEDKDKFLTEMKANPLFYNAVASAEWSHNKKVFGGDIHRTAYSWRWGQQAAHDAPAENVIADPYVKMFDKLNNRLKSREELAKSVRKEHAPRMAPKFIYHDVRLVTASLDPVQEFRKGLNLYDIGKDVLGLVKSETRQTSFGPVEEPADVADLEKKLKRLGFQGYSNYVPGNPDAIAVFKPVVVKQVG